MSEGRCVIGQRKHAATIGYVCEHHLQRLGQILREIEDEATMLSPVPSMQIRGGGGGTLASQRAPVRLDVIVHTDRRRGTGKSETDDDALAAGPTLPILDVLGSWARIVREERELTDPDTVTITGERDVLSRHLTWVAAQPWVDEAYSDLATLLSQLKGSNGTRPERPVGRCWHPNGDEECGGAIRRASLVSQPWTTLADRCVQIDVETTDGHAYCERCGCTWDGPQLATLNYELERARRPKDDRGEPMWSSSEIASEHDVKVGTIAVWAHRRGIVSTGGYYDPRAFRERMTG